MFFWIFFLSPSINPGETGWTVIPWFPLLSLFENTSDICFLPVLGNISWLLGSFKDEWPCLDIHQLCMHHPRFQGLYNLFKGSLFWSSSTKGKSFLLQTFSLVSGTWNSWWQIFQYRLNLSKTHPCTLRQCPHIPIKWPDPFLDGRTFFVCFLSCGSSARSSFLIHSGLWFFLIRMHHPWAQRRWSLINNQLASTLSLPRLSPMAVFQAGPWVD